MNAEIKKYIASLDLPKPAVERINRAYLRATRMSPEPLPRCFVSEYVEENGQRTVESVAFFSENLWLEADDVLTSNSIYALPVQRSIRQVEVSTVNYELEKATAKSRIAVGYSLRSVGNAVNTAWSLKASGSNCDTLMEIVRDIFLANMAI